MEKKKESRQRILSLSNSIEVFQEIWKGSQMAANIEVVKIGWCSGAMPDGEYGTFATLEIDMSTRANHLISLETLAEVLEKINRLTGWADCGFSTGSKGLSFRFSNYDITR